MTRAEAIERAARALVTQLDVTGLATIGIYAVAAVHGCVYDGPTYKDEKEALRAALAMPREVARPVAWGVQDVTLPDLSFASRLQSDCDLFAAQCAVIARKTGPYRVVPLYATPPATGGAP